MPGMRIPVIIFLLILIQVVALYRKTDGGSTWTRVPQANIPAKLPVESGTGGKSYSAIGNTIWFASSAGRCFKSVDGGNNWTAVMVEPGTVH